MFVETKEAGEVAEVPANLSDDCRVLLAAASIMERDGFAQGCLEKDGRVCLIGSILKALVGSVKDGDWHPEGPKRHPLTNRILHIAGMVHPMMARWNDADGRTKDEVVARMRAVALGL